MHQRGRFWALDRMLGRSAVLSEEKETNMIARTKSENKEISVLRQRIAGLGIAEKTRLDNGEMLAAVVADVRFILQKAGSVPVKKTVVKDGLCHGFVMAGKKVCPLPSKRIWACPAKFVASELDTAIDKAGLVVRLVDDDPKKTEYALPSKPASPAK